MFQFSLQEVLEFRQEKLEECEREYLKAAQELKQARAKQEALGEERRETIDSLRDRQEAGISPGESWIFQNYIEDMDARAFDLAKETWQCEQIMQYKRDDYLLARREVEVMEKLREQEFRGYQYKERKNEEKMLNDLAIFKYRGHSKTKQA